MESNYDRIDQEKKDSRDELYLLINSLNNSSLMELNDLSSLDEVKSDIDKLDYTINNIPFVQILLPNWYDYSPPTSWNWYSAYQFNIGRIRNLISMFKWDNLKYFSFYATEVDNGIRIYIDGRVYIEVPPNDYVNPQRVTGTQLQSEITESTVISVDGYNGTNRTTLVGSQLELWFDRPNQFEGNPYSTLLSIPTTVNWTSTYSITQNFYINPKTNLIYPCVIPNSGLWINGLDNSRNFTVRLSDGNMSSTYNKNDLIIIEYDSSRRYTLTYNVS